MPKKAKKLNLTTLIVFGILSPSLLVAILLAAFWVGSEYLQFRTMSEEMEAQYIIAQKSLLKSEVGRVIDYIKREKGKAEARLKADIKSRVYEAFAIAEGIYRRYTGKIPAGDIEKMVIETLRTVRFNNGRGYFFATELKGIERLFTDKPELENRNLIDMQDTNGQYVIRDMISLVRAEREGYYLYHWTKPKATGKGHPKIAFIKHFEPFDWFIGTGEYIEDVENDIKTEVIDHIEQIKFGVDGYVFVGTFEGVSLAKPAKYKNMWDVSDEKGVKIVQELIAKARSGGGFVKYVMPKLEGLSSAPKLSYADKIDDWQWYIGAGIYVDEINTVLARKREELKKQIRQDLFFIVLTLLGVVALTLIIARLFTQRLRHSLKSFTRFFETASTEVLKIDKSNVAFSEFDDLANSANRMIDERKKADQALKESLEWNQTILRSIQSGILVIDAEAHTVVDVNPEAVEMIGLPREAIIGHACHTFICASQESQCPILDLGQDIDREERVLIKPDGTQIPILETVTRANMVNRPYLIESFLDLSKQKKLESQLQQSQKFEAIGTLAGGIAHDFNNLLMGIQGRASLMSMNLESHHPCLEHIKVIMDCTRSAAELTQQLLGFARGGKYEVHPIDINDLVLSSSSMFGRTKKEIRIHTKLHDPPPITAADRTQIEQVLLNLYVNAWQAMPDGGELYLETLIVDLDETHCKPHNAKPGSFVKISVTDTGIGMDESTRQRAFDPFFTTKVKERGTGLGLASTYGIVNNHSGIISIDSEVGQGTTVNVYLPTSDQRAHREIHLNEDLALGSETILLVDDEEIIINVTRPMLEKLGYNVFVAERGEQAVDLVHEKADKIDLIVLDMIMPGMDGGKTFERIREIQPKIPVILSSGYSLNDKANEIIQRGCNGFIQKPFNVYELSRKLRKVLDTEKDF